MQALFTKVHADPRHRDVRTLVQIEVGKRLFAGQPMGFYDAAEEELDFGSSEPALPDLPVTPHDFSWQGLIALRLLARFRN